MNTNLSILDEFPMELEMQELEAMEAPGFWTGLGIGVGITAVAVVVASSYVVSVTIT